MSSITIINQTAEPLRIAIFKHSHELPGLDAIVWQVVMPSPGGQTVVQVPDRFEVFGNYSSSPYELKDPTTENKTNTISISGYTGTFEFTEANPEQIGTRISLAQTFDDLVPGEIRLRNTASIGVWGHIAFDGADIYAPQVIWPGGVMVEDVTPELWVALIPDLVTPGTIMKPEQAGGAAVEIREGQVATVTGSEATGYSVTVR